MLTQVSQGALNEILFFNTKNVTCAQAGLTKLCCVPKEKEKRDEKKIYIKKQIYIAAKGNIYCRKGNIYCRKIKYILP